MAIDTRSKEADKLANLYRAAFYLAKGAQSIAIELLEKTSEKFPKPLFKNNSDRLKYAESVLDRYMILKSKTLSKNLNS